MTEAQLFFGRSIAGRAMVSDGEWRRFLDEEVTPRFPNGFSVADISGQWRNSAGMIAREQSKDLVIVIPVVVDNTAKLNAIRDAYKSRFNQDSVVLAEYPICAGF